ncbi:MAG TPA: flagellar biosynthesis protein FlhB [Oligoflexia bacterium]|nr:flagellar biosynthesis protein FlhB [Oligoflexia bacterium]HMP48781.1 flagellar biosynthesis protein FlhB [Oligoflexia bacterium]
MAENDSAEKTEEPTQKKLSEARTEGQVAQSTDLSAVVSMTAAVTAFYFVSPYLWNALLLLLRSAFSFSTHSAEHDDLRIFLSIGTPIKNILPLVLVIMFSAAIFGALTTLIQTKFLFTMKPLKPKLSKLSPITGLKRLFGANNWFNLAKSIIKLAIIAPVGFATFSAFFPSLLGLMTLPISQHLLIGSNAMLDSFVKIMSMLLILAIIDYSWQYWRNNKKLKMSKQEIKDENKATEGDEVTKRKMLANALQRARKRMMQDVPKADVVVTNPTHIAVALSYSGEAGSAPVVLAKGRGFVAKRIREIAKENGVPIVERKPLARALFASVEVGKEIPYELFKAVAEVLAYVYRIKGRRPKIKNSSEARQ